jgi:hypothetical protein
LPKSCHYSRLLHHHSRLLHLLSPLKTHPISLTTQGLPTSCHHSRLLHLLSPLKAHPPSLTTQVLPKSCHYSRLLHHHSRLLHLLSPLKAHPISLTTQGLPTSCHHSRLLHFLSPPKAPPHPVPHSVLFYWPVPDGESNGVTLMDGLQWPGHVRCRPAGNAGSNSAEVLDCIYLPFVSSGLCDKLITRSEDLYRVYVSVCLCMCVCF